jgi:hypothetical protein
MSNQTILERMLIACDRFDASEIDTVQLSGEIESLAKSLAFIWDRAAVVVEEFRWAVQNGCDSIEGDKEDGWRQINGAVCQLREWVNTELAELSVNPSAPNPDAPHPSQESTDGR